MIGTISPMVDGERTRGVRPLAHWVHLAGSIVGGAATGVAVALGGVLIPSGVIIPLTIVLGSLYALHELGLLRMPAPERHAQVPVRWRTTLPTRVTAGAYGVLLGAGFVTHITTTTYYVMWPASLASGIFVWPVVVGAAYGASRALPPLLIASRLGGDQMWSWYDQAIRGNGRTVHVANGLVLAIAVAIASTKIAF